MGLSASQARLLTITARKSDCEYESMRLSHQKIALSRDMDVVSAEYQDAINQTKLMYDFYGNNTEVNPLTYNLLMSPSALNDYIPTTITDKAGRVVLNPALARAAKAAGIPQEGMDGLPSSDMRNAFIDGLVANDVISDIQGENIKKTTYNQTAGVGSEDLVCVNTAECSYTELVNNLLKNVTFDLTDIIGQHNYDGGQGVWFELYKSDRDETTGEISGYTKVEDPPDSLSLADILNGNYVIRGSADHQGDDREFKSWELLVDFIGSSTLWDSMFEGVENLLDTGDSYTQAALEYASSKVMEMVELLGQRDDSDGGNVDYSNFAYWKQLTNKWFQLGANNSTEKVMNNVDDNVNNYVGIVYIENSAKENEGKYNDGYGLNISYMAQAYLTYFAQYMEGISNSDYNVDKLREQGVKAGLLKLRVFRPFPVEEIAKALSHLKAIAVLDKADSLNAAGGALFEDVTSAMYVNNIHVPAVNYVYGIGGRDTKADDIESVYTDLLEIVKTGKIDNPYRYLGLRKEGDK